MCAGRPRFCFPRLMNQTQGPIYRQESVSTPLGFVRKRLYRHRGRGAALFDVLKGASLSQRCGGRLWCRRSVFRFALTRMEECSVCSVTLVMWLLSLFVMFLTLISPRGPACRTNKRLFLLCIVHSIFVVEKQKRRVMSDVIYFLLASTAGAATHGHKPKLRGF